VAFNPFHSFRRYQKAWFAALTIMCMITFVLTGSSGYFRELSVLFGGSGGYLVVAELYGKKISPQDIQHTQLQRRIANSFMVNALWYANQNASTALMQALKDSKIDKRTVEQLQQILMQRSLYAQLPQYRKAYYEILVPQISFQLEQIRETLLLAKNQVEAELVGNLEDVMRQEGLLSQRSTGLYFEGTSDAQGALDFMIWLRQADRLGITLNPGDVTALVDQETRKLLRKQDEKEIFDFVARNYGNVTANTLRSSLADEFRVRLAQEALQGSAGIGIAQVTPYEFWKFYQKERTESEIAVLPIPVEQPDFLKKVVQASENDLLKLYKEGKELEPNPDSEKTGFKQGTRVQLEWVRARPDMPFFKQAGALATAITQATMPEAFELALFKEYTANDWQFPAPAWTKDRFLLHNSSLYGPAMLGALEFPAGIGGNVLAAAASVTAGATVRESADRVRFGVTLLLSGSAGVPLTPAAVASYGTPVSPYLPPEAVKDQLTDLVRESLTRKLTTDAMQNLESDLRKHDQDKPGDLRDSRVINTPEMVASVASQLSAAVGTGSSPIAAANAVRNAIGYREFTDYGPRYCAMVLGGLSSPVLPAALAYDNQLQPVQELKSIVARAIERYGLDHGTTTKPRDKYTLAEDPGMASLKGSYFRFGEETDGTKDQQFSNQVFSAASSGPLYSPQRLPSAGEDYIYWKTEEFPAYVPSFEEVRTKVKKRWEMEKARQFAKEEAERIAGEARKTNGEPDRVLVDGSKDSGRVFYLDKVAALVYRPSFVPNKAGMEGSYEPYRVPADKIPYPSDDTVKELLSLKDRTQVIVFQDKPETTYYVAALKADRFTPYDISFFHDAAKPEMLLAQMEKDERLRKEYEQGCLKELRAEAGLKIKDEDYFQKKGEQGGSLED
jgi:hypothetical protein